MSYLSVTDLKKSYGEGYAKVNVLNNTQMAVEKGEMCTILGPSGSGKSTLLNVIGGLDGADSGKIIIEGTDILTLNPTELSNFRRDYLGFVFQFYNLVPNLTVSENIQVGAYLTSSPLDTEELLEILGLTDFRDRFPQELSGGQQQRCSIGRAIIKNPKLLLCDEPTGALDYKTSKDILSLIEKINTKFNTTVLIVTHNETIGKMTHKTVYLKDGTVLKTVINDQRLSAAQLEW